MARDGYYARMFKLQAASYAAEEPPTKMTDTDEARKGVS